MMTFVNLKVPRLVAHQIHGLDALVGNTPLLPLHKVTKGLSPYVRVYAKAEWFNPSGSVKDRAALNIIRVALETGELSGGKRLLDSTSGNTGIAYATFGASLGIPVTLVVPSNASPERLGMLRALGAELVLSDPLEGSDGALRVAHELSDKHPDLYFYANQYDNPANWQAHYQGTGPEIMAQTGGEITHFVAGMGTTGTLIGTGRYLREVNPQIQVIAAQPSTSFHGLEGLKHIPTAIQPGIYDPAFPDAVIDIETEDARAMVRRLAHEEGLFAGISSGAATVAALQVASKLHEGVVVTIFPDAGFKYLSDKKLWEGA